MSGIVDRLIVNFTDVSEFNYSVHVAEDFGFIYFSNPKTACTTAKASINLTTAKARGQNLEFLSLGDIHDRKKNVLSSPAEVGYEKFENMLRSSTVRKFAFVREPISRFASAFASKLSFENPLSDKVKSYLGKPHDTPIQDVLNINEFAQMVAQDHTLRDLDEHWRLQRKQICFEHVSDLEIGHQENAQTDLGMMLDGIFGAGQAVFFNARESFPNNASNSHELTQSLSERARENIKSAYIDDYDMITRAKGIRPPS